ncbi:MAG TPA: J domain-containing protein, partial [Candidatus Limnocylindrales bacterium]|nr:J domain-containing protein [Candidatus Limnocylindrales bacterium]
MTPAGDPYRTLGLDPGATPTEIKRAYRRLAKAYHPDSAGERALPRFLAIQAAYERLMAGQGGTRAPGAAGPARRSTGQASPEPPPTSRPWSADAERARATRDAFRKRSTRTGPRPGSAGPAAGGTGSGSTAGSTAGSGGPAGGSPSGGPRPGRASRRGRPKATIGSTSYDGAEGEPFEPGWSGAGWYGAASGTYWTINPKEFADPRKHGPEYLARARRGAKSTLGQAEPVGDQVPATDPVGPSGAPGNPDAADDRETKSAPRGGTPAAESAVPGFNATAGAPPPD